MAPPARRLGGRTMGAGGKFVWGRNQKGVGPGRVYGTVFIDRGPYGSRKSRENPEAQNWRKKVRPPRYNIKRNPKNRIKADHTKGETGRNLA